MSDNKNSERAQSTSSSGNRPEGAELSIDLLAVLNRRKGLIIASGFLGLLAGAAYFLFMPPAYESRAQILVMQNDSAAMATQMTNSQGSVSEDLLATHMSMLQSKRVVKEALANSGLSELPSIVDGLSEKETATDYVIDNLYVTRGGDGAARDARILSLAFRHNDPIDSQKVTQAILDEYKTFVKAKFQDVNKEAVELINKARLEMETDIDSLSKEYRAFRSDSPILSTSQGGANIYAMRYEELSADLSTLMVAIDESRGRLELVKSQLKLLENSDAHELQKLALIDERNAERLGILVTVERGEAATAAFQAMQPERMAGATSEYSSLLVLKGQLTQAMNDFGPKHPEVKTLETQVNEMETFLKGRQKVLGVDDEDAELTPDDVMNAYVSLLSNDLLAQEQRKLDLERQIAEAETKAKQLVDYELEDEERVRELARSEDLYSSVVERLRDINMQQDTSALIQEVIEEPILGEQVSPNAPIAAAIAMLTTMLLAGSTVLLAELSDKRIHSSEDLEAIYGTQVISHVPDFDRDAETRLLMKKIEKTEPKISSSILTYHDSKSRMSEAFRSLRTQLLMSLRGDRKIMCVTSPSQGDGKSTTTGNLAVAFAQTGKSVLLIDCDMRRPSLHTLFGLSGEIGLADVVNGSAELPDACQAGPVASLIILTAGQIPDNPAELLESDSFRGLLESVKTKYDYIILDCPPVLPVSDPCIIATQVDLALLVTSLDASGLPKAKQCGRLLEAANAPLAGIVVNRAGKSGSYYAYSGYAGDYSEYRAYQEAK